MNSLKLEFFFIHQVEANRNKTPLSEDWIPQEEIEGNAYCRYPES